MTATPDLELRSADTNAAVSSEVDRRAVLFNCGRSAVESVWQDVITGRWTP